MIVEEFLRNVSEEIGFKLGTPWRYNDKSLGVVVPILKIGDAEERVYVTLEEAKDKGITFKDTGRIDKVIVESSIGKPVFIRSGTAFKSGGTQPRAVETSVVIVPDVNKGNVKDDIKDGIKEEIPIAPIITKHEVPVRCIYASKGIRSNAKFEYGGDVPMEVRSALMSKSGQSSVWGAVNNATSRFRSSSNSTYGGSSSTSGSRMNFAASHITNDNLVGVMEEVDKAIPDIDDILKNVPLFEDQVGAVFLDTKDVVALEMFDHPKSWEAIHKEVEKRLGESAAKEQDSFYKPDYNKVKPLALAFLKKLLESEKKEVSKSHGVSTFILKGEGIIGEATVINGKVIHLVGIKSDKNTKEKDILSTIISRAASVSDVLQRDVTSGARSYGTHNHVTYSTTQR